MEFYEMLSIATGFYIRPLKTLSIINYRFRDKLLIYGFTLSVISHIGWIVSRMLLRSKISIDTAAIFLSVVVYHLFTVYFIMFTFVGMIVLFLGLSGREVRISELTGMFLISDFPFFITLPLGIVFYTLPVGFLRLYSLIGFGLLTVSLILKVRAISLSARITVAQSIGVILFPYVLFLLFIASNIFYFGSRLLNLMRF